MIYSTILEIQSIKINQTSVTVADIHNYAGYVFASSWLYNRLMFVLAESQTLFSLTFQMIRLVAIVFIVLGFEF